MSDGYNGYYVGSSENSTTYYVNKSNTDTLYYPHNAKYENCNGYWLASPSADNASNVVFVDYDGGVHSNTYDSANYAFRPVVCLPSNIF